MTTNLSSFLSSTYIGKRGFGLFNSEIDNSASLNCTTVKTSAITFPSDSEKYLVRSILLTNISGLNANITAEVTIGTSNTQVLLANNMPLNSGSTLELIKKPKVFDANNAIMFTASSNSAVSAYVTYQADTSLKYFGSGLGITSASNTDVFTASQGDAIVESIHLTNISNFDADIDLYIAHSNGTPISYIGKSYVVPSGAAIELNEQPKFLTSGQKIVAKAPLGDLFAVAISGIYR